MTRAPDPCCEQCGGYDTNLSRDDRHWLICIGCKQANDDEAAEDVALNKLALGFAQGVGTAGFAAADWPSRPLSKPEAA